MFDITFEMKKQIDRVWNVGFFRAEYEASLEANRFPVPKLDIYIAQCSPENVYPSRVTES
jgi:hypothetical protein